LAGFEVAVGAESVDTPSAVAGFDDRTTCRGLRTATPAALRYALAVFRRTLVASSISAVTSQSPHVGLALGAGAGEFYWAAKLGILNDTIMPFAFQRWAD
jgi:hypothetical protein